MAEVLNKEGVKVSEQKLNEAVFGTEVKEHLFYEVVKMQLANRRSGTASTKTKGEVSGGGVKPWKQKGTGRARSGSTRSPLWRHGGTVFGPHPRDYSYSVPKKVKKDALRSAMNLREQDGGLKIIESLDIAEPRTKLALALFSKANLSNGLVVVDSESANIRLATRNLKDFKLIDVRGLNVYDILNYDNLIITKSALEKVEAMVQ